MTNPDRWQRIEELCHEALAREPGERETFVVAACGDDVELRQEIESLLAQESQAERFLETREVQGEGGLAAGTRLGPYEITSLIGAGGMGEVYLAHDTRLDRDVAIKTLPPEFAQDPARLARLRREARTLAALNHPNIAGIYGLETSAEADYLVLELVEGEPLHGPVPLAMALELAGQVAEALQAAHEHGIIHRDLKPANVKITPKNRVKVLDFGLAKAIWTAERAEPAQPSPAATEETLAGQIVGTPAYMSPEQARGGEVDQRTDIWAFGCLLFELLAGRRPFEGTSVSEMHAAVLEREPDWSALPPKVPTRLRALLRQCLQKERNCRPDDVGVIRETLQRVRHAGQHRRTVRIRAVAVLPLANLSQDPEQDYFVDGMTETLIAELAEVGALRVISRTSTMHYKGTTKTIPQIARELGVDGIIEGSVTRAGERVRITAQLIHAATDRHLWARTYERNLRDVLHLQGEVARAIVDQMQVALTPRERARLGRTRPVNVDAHEAYIRGRYDWARAHLGGSIEHFQRAVAIDPEYALAYAGIADAQCRMFGAAVELTPPTQAAPLARAAALRALALDESLPEPHVSLSRVLLWYDRDPVAAEREVRRAIRLNPNNAMAHFVSGLLFADVGRSHEAMAALQRALRLDPVSSWNSAIAGFFMCELDQREEGRRQLRKSIDLDPSFFLPWSLSSVIDCYEGKLQEAMAAADEGVRLSGGLPMARAYAGYALAQAGRRTEVFTILEQLEDLSRERYVPAIARAWCLVGLGDYGRTLEWLEMGFQQRDSHLPHVRLMHAYAPLRSDHRFQDLLRRLGLPGVAVGGPSQNSV